MTVCRVLAGLLFAASAAADGGIGKPCFANETAMELFADMDLTGKVAVVTGANRGIGLEIIMALAARKATVVPAVRTAKELNETAEAIKKAVPGAKVFLPPASMDLSSFAVVRSYAESLQGLGPIDILVNNAGMANNPHQLVTKDGFEMAFQVDYPSQWLLTDLLMPQIRKAKGRVVNLVSKAYRMACVMSMRMQCMNIDRLPPPVITGSQKVPIMNIPVSNYGISRLLMIRWTEDLARREQEAGTGVTAFSVNPGFVNTSMADKGNLSPFFEKLACATEGRTGAPCPTLPSQGALTPTFLALAPGLESESGSFFEWCETASVRQCLDVADGRWLPTQCSGVDQQWKDDLWAVTSQWVENFSSPLVSEVVSREAEVVVDGEVDAFGCPKWLGFICQAWQCATGCLKELGSCIGDAACKKSLISAVACSSKMMKEGKSASEQLACFVPVNTLRDGLFYCLIDEHQCIHPDKDSTPYPACRDHDMAGDASYKPTSLIGDWWKVAAWTKGEMYECRPCGRVTFSKYQPLPWPVKEPVDTSDYAIISSSWYEKDGDGKQWVVNETSLFGPRPNHAGFPQKQNHVGVMYGVSYLENFTVVHDGTSESEPFLFLYGCGGTVQGTYVTGFVMAKTPVASPTLKSRIAELARASGLGEQDEWCEVDNSCPPLDAPVPLQVLV